MAVTNVHSMTQLCPFDNIRGLFLAILLQYVLNTVCVLTVEVTNRLIRDEVLISQLRTRTTFSPTSKCNKFLDYNPNILITPTSNSLT